MVDNLTRDGRAVGNLLKKSFNTFHIRCINTPPMMKTAEVEMSNLGPYGAPIVNTPPKIKPEKSHKIRTISGSLRGRVKTTPNPSQNNSAVIKSNPGIF